MFAKMAVSSIAAARATTKSGYINLDQSTDRFSNIFKIKSGAETK
jgi:hypothetical protein